MNRDFRTKAQRAWLNEVRWRIDHDIEFWERVKAAGQMDAKLTHYSFRFHNGECYFVKVTHEGRGYLILRILGTREIDGMRLPDWPYPIVISPWALIPRIRYVVAV